MTSNDNDRSKKERSYLPRSYGHGRAAISTKEYDQSESEEEAPSAMSSPSDDDRDIPEASERVAGNHVHDTTSEDPGPAEPVTDESRETLADEEDSQHDEEPEAVEGTPSENDPVPLEAATVQEYPAPDESGAPEDEPEAEDARDAEESVEIPSVESTSGEEAAEDLSDAEEPAKLIMEPQEEPPASEKEPLKVIVNLVGIRFDYAGKIYHFDAEDMKLEMDEWVIVRTEKGIGLGRVALPSAPREVEASRLDGLRKVMRRAGKVDFERRESCRRKESEAYLYCLERIEDLGLPMKLVAVECFFDGSKYVFFFTAEGRVDFRELVKQLVARYPVRIEMRQIGVRHESKMTGGLACCGQELCCARFLTEFRPVSVKMAKNQNLSLNPSKISGVCGRLMCCLGYEHEIYENFKRGLPKVGKPVTTTKGCGVMVKHNPLTETTLVRLEDESTIEVRKEDIQGEAAPAPKKNGPKVQPARKGKRSDKKKAKDTHQD